jgi:hypothetical protein
VVAAIEGYLDRAPVQRMSTSARPSFGCAPSNKLERAQAGYDEAFERKLADVIIRAIADQSMIDNVLVLRTGESAAALVNVLASIMALSPSSTRSRAAIKQVADSFRRKLLARVRQAESDPLFSDFKSRCFHDGDRARGGRA